MYYLAPLFLLSSLFGEFWKAPGAITESGSIANVFGVNVISGDYTTTETLFTVEGAAPYQHQLFFSPYTTWADATGAKLDELHLNGNNLSWYYEAGRAPLGFTGAPHKRIKFESTEKNRVGVTNIGQGRISGQTNHYNRYYYSSSEERRHAEQVNIDCGDGTKKILKLLPKESRLYYLAEERLPSGLYLRYRYDKKYVGHDLYAEDQLIRKVDFITDKQPLPYGFNYHLTRWDKAVSKRYSRVYSAISRDQSFPLFFEYWMEEEPSKDPDRRKFGFYISKRLEGREGRVYQFIKYFNSLEPEPGRELAHSFYHGRVRSVGHSLGYTNSDKEVTVASFMYDLDEKNRRTFVSYGKGYKETYFIDSVMRVKEIERYDSSEAKEPVYREIFDWGNEGNLMHKDIFIPESGFLERVSYTYDERGNILKEVIRADFSGGKADEERVKQFTYSQDDFNLLLSEDDGHITLRYQYKPGTNLLTRRIVEADGKIQQRRFQEFGKYATPILKIEDDGVTDDLNNLTSVTERRIERFEYYTDGPLIGFVKAKEESYLDIDTHTEIPLRRSCFSYDDQGNLIKTDVYDANGVCAFSTSSQFNAHRLPLKTVDALGFETTYTYNEVDQLISEKGPLSEKFATYNFAKLKTEERIGSSFRTQYGYDNKLNAISIKDPRGNISYSTFDTFGRVISERGPPQETLEGIKEKVTAKEYDAVGNVVSETDALGRSTRKTYNSFGKITSITYPDGSEEHFTYDLYGNRIEHVARNETVTRYTYDPLDREINRATFSKENELLSSSSKKYRGFRLIEEINPLGLVTTYRYDGAGRLIEKREGDHSTTFSYDALGNVAEKREDESFITRYTYDSKGQILSETILTLDGTVQKKEEYAYDAMGRKIETIAYTSKGLAITRIAYDELGRVTETTDPLGQKVVIEYRDFELNELGQHVLLKITTDPTGSQIRELHDAYERVTLRERFSPFSLLLSREKYIYDLCGNIAEKIHSVIYQGEIERELVTSFEYNSMNQVVTLTENRQRTTEMSYTKFGEKSLIVKPDRTKLHYEYNSMGTVSRFYSENASTDIEYSFTYNPLLQVLTATDEKNQTTISRTYDTRGNLLVENFPYSFTEITYDNLSRPVHFRYGSQFAMEHHYNGILLHRILAIEGEHRHLTTYSDYDLSCRPHSINDLHIERDLLGREVSIEHSHFSQTEICYSAIGEHLSDKINGKCRSFTYDPLSQLIQENQLRYSYDSLHCRRSKNDDLYRTSPLNELLHDGKTALKYDACGRCTQDGEWEFEYDALDRLVRATSFAETLSYSYDAFNRCLSRNDTHFLYQGNNEIGSLTHGKTTHFRFLGSGKGAEIGAAVLLYLNGTLAIPLHDTQGSVSALISLSGKLLNTYSYTAFGELDPREPSFWSHFFSSTESPWLFASKRLDPSLQLYQFGRRHYDPARGRWLTPDPKGYSQGPNLYVYVANNPLILFDLYGLEAKFSFPLDAPPKTRFFPYGVAVFSYNGEDFHSDYPQISSNGICNSYEDACNFARNISHAFRDNEGRPSVVDHIYVASNGLPRDLYSSAKEYARIESVQIQVMHQLMNERLLTLKEGQSCGIDVHSRSSIILQRAAEGFELGQLERFDVRTMGAACFAKRDMYRTASNYTTSYDYVANTVGYLGMGFRPSSLAYLTLPVPGAGIPFLASLCSGIIKARADYDIEVVPCISMDPHSTVNYWPAIEEAGNNYRKERDYEK